MNEKNIAIHRLSGRLLISLGILIIAGALLLLFGKSAVIPALVIIVGAIGGFVSLQRRLIDLSSDTLDLLSRSWFYTIQAPLVGGILALLLYILFLSKLVQGELFPTFIPDTDIPNAYLERFEIIFFTHGNVADYAKLVFWCFFAGFSENFVTNMFGQFEKSATSQRVSSPQDGTP